MLCLLGVGDVGDVELLRDPRQEAVPVVDTPDADIDAGHAPGETERRQPRVLQCLPAHLQQQSLLRVERMSLSWRDPEQRRVHKT